MKKKGISEEIIKQFESVGAGGSYIEQRLATVDLMDRLLSKEQCLSVMEEQGCCVTGKPAAAHRAFGRKHEGKTVEERLRLFDELDTPHKPPCKLNGDGTLSVFWGFGQDGDYKCVCGNIGKLPQPVSLSPTYCGCCGGHVRQNLQKSLGVKLRLKEIVSSPVSSNGKKRCEFLFEII